MDIILKVGGAFVQQGYNLGFLPFSWNAKQRQIELPRNKWRIYLWWFMVTISSLVWIGQVYLEITGEDGGILGKFRLLQILGSGLGTLFQINTVIKLHQIVGIVNQCIMRFTIIEHDGVLRKFPKIALLLRKATKTMVGCAISVPIGVAYLAIVEHNPKFFGWLFWIDLIGRREHWNTQILVLVAGLEAFSAAVHLYSVLFYSVASTMFMAPFIVTIKTMRNLRRENAKENCKLLNPDYWVILYKSLYMICQRATDTLSDLVTSIGLAAILGNIVFLNFILFATEAPFLAKAPMALANIAFIAFLRTTVGFASHMPKNSEECIRVMIDGKVTDISKYNMRRLKSCMTTRVYIGPFFYLDEKSLPEMYKMIVESTVDAILTFG